MFGLSALQLARIQFGFTISLPYHLSGDHHWARKLPGCAFSKLFRETSPSGPSPQSSSFG